MNGGIIIFVRVDVKKSASRYNGSFPNVRKKVSPHSEQHPITISSLKGRFLALGF